MSTIPLPLTPSYSFTVEELALMSNCIAAAVATLNSNGPCNQNDECLLENLDMVSPLMLKISRAVSACLQ